MVSFHITPSHLLLQVPQDPAFPTAQLAMPTLRLEIQLVRCALLCWEETWAWRGIWHTPAAPQGCSKKELLSPHKAPRAGCMSHMPLSVTDSRCKASAAPCAAGGEIREALGHCPEAVRSLSVLLLGQWHQVKGEPILLVLCKQEWCAYAPSDDFQAHPPLPCLLECRWSWTSLQMCESVLHSLCTDVNDYMRCEAGENQAPKGFSQDGK